jgi:N-methylhydantoinase A/oxoprolinase/acetone carboxylase beta subunit
MAIKNPAHELVAKKAIALIDPKPVFCSHEISVHAGMQERAATACLHARLMPIMEKFIGSVAGSMLKIGLKCPVVMICGDGLGVSLDEAVKRAAVTVASGPAATVHFGVTAGHNEALIVDVGGTTTDVCMIHDGQPLMNEQGCRVGSWQTHVRAVDMYTGAGGGDSHVLCRGDGSLLLANYRVQPLAMTAELPDPRTWLGRGQFGSLILPSIDVEKGESRDEIISFLLENGPATPETIARRTRMNGVTLEKHLDRLVYKQKIVRVGFTPTDALHVLQRLQIGDHRSALSGAEILAKEAGLTIKDFCHQVLKLTEDRIEAIILDYLGRKIWGNEHAVSLVNKRNNELFEMRYVLKIPIVGIGAASSFFLTGVADRLGTTVTFPAHYEVGNAMGAGLIAGRAHAV